MPHQRWRLHKSAVLWECAPRGGGGGGETKGLLASLGRLDSLAMVSSTLEGVRFPFLPRLVSNTARKANQRHWEQPASRPERNGSLAKLQQLLRNMF